MNQAKSKNLDTDQQKNEKHHIRVMKDDFIKYTKINRSNSGLEWHGDHLYEKGDFNVSIEDRIKDEDKDINIRLNKLEDQEKLLQDDAQTLYNILKDFAMGFFDKGESFRKGLDLINQKTHYKYWVSEKTNSMLTQEEDILFGQWDLDLAQQIFEVYFQERSNHFLMSFNAIDAIETIVGFVVINLIEIPGKFTTMSPLITAIIPGGLILDCILMQVLFNVFYNNLWAEGNLLLIWTQIFTFVQYGLMLLLLWNNEIYIYDFRILRYLSFGAAIIFDIIFLMMAGSACDLIFVKGKAEDDANVYDIVFALILGYSTLFLIPTFMENAMIVMKELTMNQFAWTRDDDYKAGLLYNEISIDILQWFDIPEDTEYYSKKLQRWTRSFL